MGELKAVNTIQDYQVFDYRFAAVGRQTNRESFFYRDYIKKEHCKISMIQLSDLQNIQVHSYNLNGLVPDIKDIKSFDFMQRNSQSFLLHYQTKHTLSVKIVYPKDFYKVK
ncbi:hypothetical protein GXP67_12095 [Rhodocytophaga rosea]|uniref:Uncharacterized protein n=1 Tax=Rhodocytophaga rosea TaxID=2704465 RepID=A0A6C0GI09_9BACT|nr:hypothetical protein [Rhodocytophaga rosea]QHT67322.1 hypothetical protein GXP67_12095 [Rhodocytophaga rosea]